MNWLGWVVIIVVWLGTAFLLSAFDTGEDKGCLGYLGKAILVWLGIWIVGMVIWFLMSLL